jgi:hypothetical protein
MTFFERTNRMRYPTLVLLNKRIFAGVLAFMWLAGVMRCPLEAAGVFPNDYCCGASSSAPAEPAQSAKSECSYNLSARSHPLRPGGALLLPGPIIDADISTSIPSAENRGCLTVQPSVEVSVLAQCWQFLWRTATAPRAPSFLA